MRLLLLSLFLLVGGCAQMPGGDLIGAAAGAVGALEVGFDRNGNDYRSFAMNGAGAEACRTACRDDARCRAFTWTRPGYQDPSGMCWLKDGVPAQTRLAEATSGVVRR